LQPACREIRFRSEILSKWILLTESHLFICKMETIIVPISWEYPKNKWDRWLCRAPYNGS
jgi:hypothetical protein